MQLMNFLCGTTSRQALGAQPRRTGRRVPVRAAHQRAPDRLVPPQPGQCRHAAVTTQRAHQRHCRHAMQARSAAVLVTAAAAPPPPSPSSRSPAALQQGWMQFAFCHRQHRARALLHIPAHAASHNSSPPPPPPPPPSSPPPPPPAKAAARQ